MNVYLGELYKEVEYIQSNGTQYINTGYIPSNTTKIQISMGGWTYVQQYAHLFGVRAAWNTTDASIGRGFLLCHQYNTSYIGMFGRGYSNNSGGWSSTKFSFANGNNHIIEMSQSGVYEDGTLKASLQTVTFTSPSNMCIFALNDNGTVKENSSYKLYYFKIWNNGTLVRDFVPCYRVSDNVIGLFDKVNNKFYTNAGTGTFTKGNDVKVFQSELKNAYIGEVYEYSYDFRNKSSTILTNDGWTVGANTTIDSNGIISSSYGSTTHEIGHSITNAKKITLTCGLYNANGMNSSYGLWGTKSSAGPHYASFYIEGYTSDASALYLDGASVQVFKQTEPSGQSEWTYTLDFENLTYNLVYSGVTKSGTMTQTQANNIRNNNTAIRLAAQYGTGRIQYVKILVE